MDLCYPGCGDFDEDEAFGNMVMKYTPCSADDCTVNILDASDTCTDCGNNSTRRLRFLQNSFQSSAITFEIVSDEPLNAKVVLSNLNGNITDANEDLGQDGTDFRVVEDSYMEATMTPTAQPTKKPSTLVSTLVNHTKCI